MNERNAETRLQESIVGMETVLDAVADARQCKPRGRRGPLDLLEDEPALQEFLKGALLEMAGKMAIHDCPAGITRLVHREASFLLAVTFKAVQQAHRELYADLLPEPEADADTDL